MPDPSPSTHTSPQLDDVTVLNWTVPRPTGRWHQAIVVTSRHVWITPEQTFGDHEAMTAAAAAGLDEFHDFVRGAGWVTRPPRCSLSEVRGLDWNEIGGMIRIGVEGGEVLTASIPDRSHGARLVPLVKRAIALRVRRGDR